MSKNRPVLKAPRPPKGNDVEAMLKFIQEQKNKPSEAKAAAKKLTKISNEQKTREKKANQANAFMKELRNTISRAQYAKQLSTSSLIDLAANFPELPEILKFDAKLQNNTNGDLLQARAYLDRLQHFNQLTRTAENNMQYKQVHEEFAEYLKSFELPEQYDTIVEIVENTKLPPPEKQKIEVKGVNDEWKQKIEDTIQAFSSVEKELKEKHKKWLIENGFNPEEKYGGWDDLEHQRFLLTNCGEVTIEFDRPPEEIIRHKKWYIRQQFLNKKIDALRSELRTRVDQMIEEAKEEEKRKEEERLHMLDVKERQEQLSQEKAELDERLKIGREEKRKRDEEKQKLEAEERRKKEEEEKRQKMIAQKEKNELKKRVLTEKERRREQEERIRKIRLEEAERQKELLKERRKEMQAAVSGRRQIDQKKKQRREEEIMEQKQKEADKQRRLELLAQQVRDEFGLDDVVADLEKPTKIMEIRSHMEKEEKPMFNPTSFASSVIENDPRIRIETALREAGLINSPYAMNVINEMSALRAAPGMQSHIKF